MKIIIDNIELFPGQPENSLSEIIEKKYKIDIPEYIIIQKKSLDSRKKMRIVYRYRLLVELPDSVARPLLELENITLYEEISAPVIVRNLNGLRVIIVGSGPAGLFCALRLIDYGAEVEIHERGKSVEERKDDVKTLKTEGLMLNDSNVLFGEGGAGAFSDGKLTTGSKRAECQWVVEKLLEFGAPESISYDAKPHVGTDKLIPIIKGIRENILSSGSAIHFNSRIADIISEKGRIGGVRTFGGEEIHSGIVVLATGHSARDIFSMLQQREVTMEKKGFAMGVRIEHPSEFINYIQYGKMAQKKILPAADYRLAYNNKATSRGTYSFCTCPGGEIINASSEKERLCINGMSYSRRASLFSNTAIVTTVREDDTPEGPLAGIELQRKVEADAFRAGGGGFMAPAQRISSFLKNVLDSSLPETSYMPGVVPAQISESLPPWISNEIKSALYHFEKKMKGFISPEGIIVGVETRSSSPVRILRDENMQSPSLKGLFPVGEGSGYAGGIMSSAVDGVRTADKIASLYEKGKL